MPEQNILILSCSTGEGHNSAAKAIENELSDRGVSCAVYDVLSFKSEKAQKRASDMYSAVIRKTPALFGLAYKLGGAYDKLRLPSPIYKINSVYAKKLYDFIREHKITCVVCTHLFAMEAMTAVRTKYYPDIRCYGVLTDYTAIPFYKDTDLDGYFVADDRSGLQLIGKGIKGHKIFVTGIPVDRKFSFEITKAEAREKLNLPSDKKIIAVMTGGAGCGKIVKLCSGLIKFLPDTAVYVFTGRNSKLKQKLDRRFCGRIATVAFTPDVNIYMKAADVLISKSGGLSSTEAAVAGVPLVHLKAIPGVETANLKFFSENGLSLRADTVKRALKAANQLIYDEQCAEAMLKIQKLFISAEAAGIIAKIVTEGRADEFTTMACVYSGGVCVGQHNVLPDYTQAVNA